MLVQTRFNQTLKSPAAREKSLRSFICKQGVIKCIFSEARRTSWKGFYLALVHDLRSRPLFRLKSVRIISFYTGGERIRTSYVSSVAECNALETIRLPEEHSLPK